VPVTERNPSAKIYSRASGNSGDDGYSVRLIGRTLGGAAAQVVGQFIADQRIEAASPVGIKQPGSVLSRRGEAGERGGGRALLAPRASAGLESFAGRVPKVAAHLLPEALAAIRD
jgi:hypothetical protein